MASRFLIQFNCFVRRLEHNLICMIRNGFHPGTPALCEVPHQYEPTNNSSADPFSIKDLIGDGMLWAVPKKRVSIERRMKKKYGIKGLNMKWKLLEPKVTLRQCGQCGLDHEVGVLCANCYNRVIAETKACQAKIKEALGLDPVDKEVIVLYDDEKSTTEEYWQGKRIIEMEKPRPKWFHNNLLQKTTTPLAKTKDVKPEDLG